MTDDIRQAFREAARVGPGFVRVVGPATEDQIRAAEDRLGIEFPRAYRDFVREFGAVEVGTREIYGVTGSLHSSGGLNVVWHTEQARERRALDRTSLVLSSWDDLTLEVMKVVDEGAGVIDGPVFELLVEGPGEHLADSFQEWLERTAAEASEDAG